MGEVITRYAEFFQVVTIYNRKSLPTRHIICTPYFDGIISNTDDSRAKGRLITYQGKEEAKLQAQRASG